MADDRKIALVTLDTASRVGKRVSVDALASETLRSALAIWHAKRGERRMPAKSDMTPQHMRGFLRYVTLFTVLENGEDFEHRIMGDAAVVAWGASFKGMRRADLNRVQPGMGDVFARLMSSVARKQAPVATRGVLWRGDLDEVNQEAVFLPLSSDGKTVDFIISVGSYESRMPLT